MDCEDFSLTHHGTMEFGVERTLKVFFHPSAMDRHTFC